MRNYNCYQLVSEAINLNENNFGMIIRHPINFLKGIFSSCSDIIKWRIDAKNHIKKLKFCLATEKNPKVKKELKFLIKRTEDVLKKVEISPKWKNCKKMKN